MSYSSSICCICFENDNLMKTFCCHNEIHHTCFVQCMAFCSSSCPLCRTEIVQAIKCDPNNKKEKFDTEIISLISNIHLNIMNIESVCREFKIKSKFLQKYKKMNQNAILKICKKVKKYLHIDIKQYFLDFMNKNKIIYN